MAKKKRKKDPNKPNQPLSGAEKQQRRQERLEQRRLAKLEEAKKEQRVARRERMVRFFMLGLVGLGIFWFLFLRDRGPSEINGHEVQKLSALGTGDHTSSTVNYETSPPVSGAHAPSPFPCGTYGEEIPNEVQVHMLEHGAIGVQYQPTLPPEQIAEIEELVASFDSHVFSAPYAASPTPISLTAWGRLMRLEEVEPDSIREFIEAFEKKGPERLDCEMASDASFEPTPEGSPAPEDGEPSPEGNGDTGDGDHQSDPTLEESPAG